jgi:hypothetical protein
MNHGPKIEIAVTDMNREHTIGIQFAQVDLDRFNRQQMNRNSVSRKSINYQDIESLRVVTGYLAELSRK